MSDSFLSRVAGVLPWKGKTYSVAVRTLDMELAFGAWSHREAAGAVERLEGAVPPHVLIGMRQHLAVVGAFTYSWESDGCRAARYSELGLRYMLWLQLSKIDRTVTREQVDAMAADPATHALMLEFAWGKLDPNPPAPENPEQPPPS